MLRTDQVFCGQCGETLTTEHAACQTASELSPPRYCSACARRLKVQVTPMGWRAQCSVHGEFEDDGH